MIGDYGVEGKVVEFGQTTASVDDFGDLSVGEVNSKVFVFDLGGEEFPGLGKSALRDGVECGVAYGGEGFRRKL